MRAPSPVAEEQLRELHLRVREEDKPKEQEPPAK
jgi:hypothetical protein